VRAIEAWIRDFLQERRSFPQTEASPAIPARVDRLIGKSRTFG